MKRFSWSVFLNSSARDGFAFCGTLSPARMGITELNVVA